jgi:hypothetical protein
MLLQEQAGDEIAALQASLTDAQDRIEHLKRAVDSHGLIGQAMGILMCRDGITADTAFATLGRVSQAHHLKLRVLSESVIATVTARTNRCRERSNLHSRSFPTGRSWRNPGDVAPAAACSEQTMLGIPSSWSLCRKFAKRSTSAGYLEAQDLPGQFDAVPGSGGASCPRCTTH